MISMQELLGAGVKFEDQPEAIRANLSTLLGRINVVRSSWNRPMRVTSGLRTLEHHLEIYRKNAEKAGKPFDPKKVPMKSSHLSGAAVDIFDPKKELQAWCKANEQVLVDAQLWCEDFSATPNWVHFQVVPPASGKRWFMP